MSITVRYGSRLTEVSPGMYVVDPSDAPADPGLYVVGTYFGPDPSERTLVGFSWGGVNFTQWGPYYLTKVEGWDAPPDGKVDDQPLAGWHGSLPGRMTRGARTVTIEGFCLGSDRDALFNALADAMAAGFGEGDDRPDLVGDVAGRNLAAAAQLQRYAPTVEQVKWGRRYFGWALQWRCPDPLRYAPAQSLSVPINTATTGLTWPITFPITYPSNPIGGQLVVNNPGNARRCPAVITLTGPLDTPGVVCVETSERLEFPLVLSESDVLSIDTGAGVAWLNGEYRAPSAVSSLIGDLSLRPGAQTLQALGTPTTGNPSISVSFRPAYW